MSKGKISIEDRILRLNEESDKTYNETIEKLGREGRCLCERPTGFGKSYMLARLSKRYKKSLYIYPINVIKESVKRDYSDESEEVHLNNVEFISYIGMYSMYKRETEEKVREYLSQFECIMLDEVHMAGAPGFMRVYREIIEGLVDEGKVKIVGVSATPVRQSMTEIDGVKEMIDVESEIFKGNKVYDFTLEDCIECGIMLEPIYKVVVGNKNELEHEIKEEAKRGMRDYGSSNKAVLEEANRQIMKMASMVEDIKGVDEQIKRTIEDSRGKVKYLKIIVFCKNRKDLDSKVPVVTEWFENMYPSMSVNYYKIMSKGYGEDSGICEDDVETIQCLSKIEKEDGKVDLIFCVDMLNMGYHCSDIDAIIMFRGTTSNIIYLQQIGRALSVKGEVRPIIFDLVNNIGINEIDRLEKDCHRSQSKEKKGKGKGVEEGNYADEPRDKNRFVLEKYIVEDKEIKTLRGLKNSKRVLRDKAKLMDSVVVHMYTVMQMPISLIAINCGKNLTESNVRAMISILNRNGIYIEDERPCRRSRSAKGNILNKKVDYITEFDGLKGDK